MHQTCWCFPHPLRVLLRVQKLSVESPEWKGLLLPWVPVLIYLVYYIECTVPLRNNLLTVLYQFVPWFPAKKHWTQHQIWASIWRFPRIMIPHDTSKSSKSFDHDLVLKHIETYGAWGPDILQENGDDWGPATRRCGGCRWLRTASSCRDSLGTREHHPVREMNGFDHVWSILPIIYNI